MHDWQIQAGDGKAHGEGGNNMTRKHYNQPYQETATELPRLNEEPKHMK
jgi:hypothetical protein